MLKAIENISCLPGPILLLAIYFFFHFVPYDNTSIMSNIYSYTPSPYPFPNSKKRRTQKK